MCKCAGSCYPPNLRITCLLDGNPETACMVAYIENKHLALTCVCIVVTCSTYVAYERICTQMCMNTLCYVFAGMCMRPYAYDSMHAVGRYVGWPVGK